MPCTLGAPRRTRAEPFSVPHARLAGFQKSNTALSLFSPEDGCRLTVGGLGPGLRLPECIGARHHGQAREYL